MRASALFLVLFTICLSALSLRAESLVLDQSPAGPKEWGYRPADQSETAVNPPSFSWRPQEGIVRWELQCAKEKGFAKDDIAYQTDDLPWNVHCPNVTLPPGKYCWRYRGFDESGQSTNWSDVRSFTIPESARKMPMPTRQELLSRIPDSHPRLFIRPEDVPRLRELAAGKMKDQFHELVDICDRLVDNPPPTAEPPKYPADIVRGSDDWKDIWWGNRKYTIRALDGAATLAFTHLLGGKEEYASLAKRILLDCAKWDPKGATGYRYNDEAGMPYAYCFARTYTFLYDQLSEQERDVCREVLQVRGHEMYNQLCPAHFWKPYASHRNRAWHFLGELGIAMHGEIDEADDWVVFATTVFYNTYPVWSDDAGGWHEGPAYWQSYIRRFTWWADVMRSALNIDAYQKPYFSQVGYYPMYLLPPGSAGTGFGDLAAEESSRDAAGLVALLAEQARNRYWEWYVHQNDADRADELIASSRAPYVEFIRAASDKPVKPKRPKNLPTSRLFAGTGEAVLNTSLNDASHNVQVVFKSSPFGTQSHGYEANNSFLLSAYGERLLIRSGHRDMYGSEHHSKWMWSARSVNNITVKGLPSTSHTSSLTGRITTYKSTPTVDLVVGLTPDDSRPTDSAEDQPSYMFDRFVRSIIFVKPELVIVYDRLATPQPEQFEYWLHAVNPFDVVDQRDIGLEVNNVTCNIQILAPDDLSLAETDQYDPNPRPRIKLREWHLTATTPEKAKSAQFVTLLWPSQKKVGQKQASQQGSSLGPRAKLTRLDGGYRLEAQLADGQVVALLPTDDNAKLEDDSGLSTKDGQILVQRRDAAGKVVQTLSSSSE